MIQVSPTISDHARTYALADALSVTNYAAVGLMVSLWAWASVHAPKGDISEYPPRAVAKAAGWTRKADTLYNAFCEVGVIEVLEDDSIIIPDMEENNNNAEESDTDRAREQTKERVKRYRERKIRNKALQEEKDSVTVTQGVTPCNADVTQSVTQEESKCNADVTLCNGDVTLQNGECNADVTQSVTLQGEKCNVTRETEREKEKEPKRKREREREDREREGARARVREESGETAYTSDLEQNGVGDKLRSCSDFYSQTFGGLMPGAMTSEILLRLQNDVDVNLLKHVMGMCHGKNNVSAYFTRVLQSLHGKGITTYEQYCDSEKSKPGVSAKQSPQTAPDYSDPSRYENISWQEG